MFKELSLSILNAEFRMQNQDALSVVSSAFCILHSALRA